ncbi:hypothetical protein ACWDMY_32080 [Streptomyces globisporus]
MTGCLEGAVRSPEAGGALLNETPQHARQIVHEMQAAENTASFQAGRERKIVTPDDLVVGSGSASPHSRPPGPAGPSYN